MAMNIIDLQEALKGMSEQQLVSEMQAPTGNAPQFLVLSELTRRNKMRQDFAKRQSDQAGTVADDAIAASGMPAGGIAAMAQSMAPRTEVAQNTGVDPVGRPVGMAPPQPMAEVQAMYSGGLVRMADGGMVNPRPVGRATEMRLWDFKYGSTHNPDGTPIAPRGIDALLARRQAPEQPMFDARDVALSDDPVRGRGLPFVQPVETAQESTPVEPSPQVPSGPRGLPFVPPQADENGIRLPFNFNDDFTAPRGNPRAGLPITAPRIMTEGEVEAERQIAENISEMDINEQRNAVQGPMLPVTDEPEATDKPKTLDQIITPEAATKSGVSSGGGGGASSNRFSSYEQFIQAKLDDLDKQEKRDKWLALAKAGAVLMSSDNPTFGGAIGEAFGAGISSLQESLSEADKREMELMAMKFQVQGMSAAEARARAGSAVAAKKGIKIPAGIASTAYKDANSLTREIRELQGQIETGYKLTEYGPEPITEAEIPLINRQIETLLGLLASAKQVSSTAIGMTDLDVTVPEEE